MLDLYLQFLYLIGLVYPPGNTLFRLKRYPDGSFGPLRIPNYNYYRHDYVKIYSLDIRRLRR